MCIYRSAFYIFFYVYAFGWYVRERVHTLLIRRCLGTLETGTRACIPPDWSLAQESKNGVWLSSSLLAPLTLFLTLIGWNCRWGSLR